MWTEWRHSKWAPRFENKLGFEKKSRAHHFEFYPWSHICLFCIPGVVSARTATDQATEHYGCKKMTSTTRNTAKQLWTPDICGTVLKVVTWFRVQSKWLVMARCIYEARPFATILMTKVDWSPSGITHSNCDAHILNQYHRLQRVLQDPFYRLVCTIVYPLTINKTLN